MGAIQFDLSGAVPVYYICTICVGVMRGGPAVCKHVATRLSPPRGDGEGSKGFRINDAI